MINPIQSYIYLTKSLISIRNVMQNCHWYMNSILSEVLTLKNVNIESLERWV